MNDRTISANTVSSVALWVIGGLLILADLLSIFGNHDNGLSELGIYVACGGGVLSIRGFFCRQSQREQAAFDLGRESVRLVSDRAPRGAH